MAWRSAWRMKGSPERATRRLRMPAGPAPLSSPSLTTRPVSIRPKVEALTNRLSEAPRCFSQRPLADLLRDQRVGRVLVGNAQQRLGEAHQDDALLGGQPVLVHEGIDAAVLVAVGARRADQPRAPDRRCDGARRGEDGALDETADKAHLVHQMIGRNLVALRAILQPQGAASCDGPGLPRQDAFWASSACLR